MLMEASKQSAVTTETEKTRTGYAIPKGTGADGIIVRIWDENTASYGQYGVVTSVEYIKSNTHEPYFTGYQYTICKCTEEGVINGGLVQMCGEDFMTWEGRRFYDGDIPYPFDDDLPF